MKIGLTYTYDETKHENYIRWLKAGSDSISIIKLSAEDNNLDELKHCDALVLSGGVDIYPGFYKSKKEAYPNAPAAFRKDRDEFEIAVFKRTQQNKLPVLGICRGFQLINCIFGGTLKQDIGRDGNKIHRFDVNDKAHGVNLVSGTTLQQVSNGERFAVNSAHHQTIKRLGKHLKINALSDDGLVEGIERKDASGKPFLLAVQWHPERMFKFNLGDSSLSKGIRDRFIEEIKKSKDKQP